MTYFEVFLLFGIVFMVGKFYSKKTHALICQAVPAIATFYLQTDGSFELCRIYRLGEQNFTMSKTKAFDLDAPEKLALEKTEFGVWIFYDHNVGKLSRYHSEENYFELVSYLACVYFLRTRLTSL